MKRIVSVAILLVLLGLAAALAVPGSSTTAPPCWKKVIADWYDNGVIDGKYPVSCLQAALRNLPEDVRDYTPLGDEIAAAIQAATGHGLPPTSPSSGGGGISGLGPPSANGSALKRAHIPAKKLYKRSLGDPSIKQAAAIPTPLLVIAGLGALLLAAAAAQRYGPPIWRHRPGRTVRSST